MDGSVIMRGFVPVPNDLKKSGLVPGLDAALWASPAEAIDWGVQMCQDSGHKVELNVQYRHREYRQGVLIREF
jgi:hypothetical protein